MKFTGKTHHIFLLKALLMKEVYNWRAHLFSTNRFVRRHAEKKAHQRSRSIDGNVIFFNKRDVGPRHTVTFPHACSVFPNHNRKHPVVVEDQNLRDLRYRQEGNPLTFAKCPHCTMSWKYPEFVKEYVR
jgi:hypothetical protein